jgi:ribosomal-protein-alanine N-acetyltransferase
LAQLGPLELETARLQLRRWRASDIEPFAAINADPRVMKHFPAPLSRAESEFMLEQIEDGFARDGFGLWALEEIENGTLLGLTGLSPVHFAAHFTPAVEVGWRLAVAAWGQGYATEAAHAALEFGFAQAGLDEIVSFTTTGNKRSIAVMRRIGMHSDASDDFDHPMIEREHTLCRHVLYRLRADEYPGGAA